MSASKRPSTSSLRRFLTSRPYVPVAEIRRRFGLDELDEGMAQLERGGQVCYIGLPEREASKLQDLWARNEVELELSVEVRAPVVIGVYPMRIARFVMEGNGAGYANGHAANGYAGNGHAANGYAGNGHAPGGGYAPQRPRLGRPAGSQPGGDGSPFPGPAMPPDRPVGPVPPAYAGGNGTGNGQPSRPQPAPQAGTPAAGEPATQAAGPEPRPPAQHA